ncbi:inorganic phosphate transporter, partial [Bacillus subtilis]
LSTSEVTVGSVVGVGVAYQSLYVEKLLVVMSFWIIVPLVSFVIAFLIGKVIKRRAHKKEAEGKWKRVLTILVIATGFFEAFSA